MLNDDLDYTDWADAVLDSPRIRAGGAILLDRADIDHYSSLGEVLAIAASRRWRVLECGNDVVVFPNSGSVTQHL